MFPAKHTSKSADHSEAAEAVVSAADVAATVEIDVAAVVSAAAEAAAEIDVAAADSETADTKSFEKHNLYAFLLFPFLSFFCFISGFIFRILGFLTIVCFFAHVLFSAANHA